ncbi:hypothetical protein CJF42_05960 [Pseudoalteromonas sp. NBT06-2]|uniref:hypothetical protein n=1 Tax=Pseudoalteromonas sp. NBT06-2 TaxID=2025950 RepID=UPI000BA5794F|nr:hypothetical protein [Pseudoalteromonas sp. NBT06-2]PAJ75304.1 hypothetical protein CJF42_05960 [Pseudoalteromonas sp. NBT06-2]
MEMIQILSKLTPEQARAHVIIKNMNKGIVKNEISLSLNLGGCVVPLDVIEPGTTLLSIRKDQVNIVVEQLKGALNRGAFDAALKDIIQKFQK